jgi:chorismate-pyruvate lyase
MSAPLPARDPVARAQDLVRLFCDPTGFGGLRGVPAAVVPEPARAMLDHRSHMTAAMERVHGSVGLRVVATASDGRYAREIILEDTSGRPVQYGIVRIDLAALDEEIARRIREARRPLGRILIDGGVLREVHDVALLEIVPGPHLRRVLALPDGTEPLHGRVAEIELNGRKAVELLEIVAPG